MMFHVRAFKHIEATEYSEEFNLLASEYAVVENLSTNEVFVEVLRQDRRDSDYARITLKLDRDSGYHALFVMNSDGKTIDARYAPEKESVAQRNLREGVKFVEEKYGAMDSRTEGVWTDKGYKYSDQSEATVA